jgi:hypothetical protein
VAVRGVVLPLAPNFERVAVGLLVLLRLEVRPEVLEGRHVDRRELVVAKPEALAALAGDEGLGAALHLNGGAAKFPDG